MYLMIFLSHRRPVAAIHIARPTGACHPPVAISLPILPCRTFDRIIETIVHMLKRSSTRKVLIPISEFC
jgi:hypothetical protein